MGKRTQKSISALTILVMVGGLVYLPVEAAGTCTFGTEAVCCCPADAPAETDLPGVGRDLCCLLDAHESPSPNEKAVVEGVRADQSVKLAISPRPFDRFTQAGLDVVGLRSVLAYHDLAPPPPYFLRDCALLI